MIRFFQAKYFGQILALIFFTALLRIESVVDPMLVMGGIEGFRQDWFHDAVLRFPLVSGIAALLLLLLQAFIFNQLLENHRLTPLNQLLPAALYVLMMSSAVLLLQPNIVLLVNFIMLLLIHNVYAMYGSQQPYSRVFNAGLLCGIAALLYAPALYFIVFIWLSMLIFQNFSIRAFSISVAGLVTPYLFMAVYYFWHDDLGVKFIQFTSGLFTIIPVQYTFDVYAYIIWAFFLLLLFTGLNEMFRRITAGTIELRRKFRVLLFFLLLVMATIPFAGAELPFHLMLALIPLTAFLSASLSQTKKLFFSELTLALILITIFTGKMINLM